MILHPESWMNIRRFRALHEAGASYAEIAAEVGCDWRTVKKYLSAGSPAVPPAGTSRKGTQPRKIAPFTGLIDSWLRAGVTLRASVICERLTAGYGYDGSYQRVKLYVAEARPKIAAELAKEDENSLAGLHRRFEVAAGAQAQVDWGEESGVLIGTPKVCSFHMTLSYSRDPFCCYTARTDLATFFGCHIRAFEYFGGVPGSVVYDRTKTVVRRHVAPGKAVPLHPEAVAFAGHYGFDIDVLAAYRPTGKPRVAYCTSSGRFVRSSGSGWSGVLGSAADLRPAGRVAGVGRVVEELSLVVIAGTGDNSGSAPGLDGVVVDAVGGGGFGEGEHAGVAEALAAAA
jgi:transposase